MGEFDFESMEQVSPLLAVVWFWGFEILMLLILFNMLLAIVRRFKIIGILVDLGNVIDYPGQLGSLNQEFGMYGST
jgi:hypothetical protein